MNQVGQNGGVPGQDCCGVILGAGTRRHCASSFLIRKMLNFGVAALKLRGLRRLVLATLEVQQMGQQWAPVGGGGGRAWQTLEVMSGRGGGGGEAKKVY